jgi:Right handed beta helix region/Bacterial TSP3 repeat
MRIRSSGTPPWRRRELWALVVLVAIAAIVVFPRPPEAHVPDRDNDGLSNQFELARSHTNPGKKDTDADGLADRFELRRSKTNPRKSDTDSDGRADGVEVRRGSDPGGRSRRCDRTAKDGASLSSEFHAARPGQTVCLTGGHYGVFHGGAKPGIVTLRGGQGASPSLSLTFSGANHIRIEDVTITGGLLSGGTRNVTIAHSRFTGILIVDQRTPNPNIVLDHNTHNNIPGAADDYTSRVHLDAPGVVVKNSLFSGGSSDGIRVGDAPNTNILRNEFTAFDETEPLHTDPIQFYGDNPRTTIRGNWFHDMVNVTAMIMMADGGGPNLIEDNLFGPGAGHLYSLLWYSDDGSIIRHNTFIAGKCALGVRCGTIELGYRPEDDRGRGTVIEDNILTSISAGDDGEGGRAAGFSSSHNLLRSQKRIGPGDLRGAPKYAAAPLRSGDVGRRAAFAAYRLAHGSRGRGNASDGIDRGIR